CAMAVSFQRLQSAREGADLAAAVRLLERPAASDAAVHGALAPALRHGGLAAIAVPSLQAQVPTPPGAAQLQRAIHLELSQPAYAWQHPRPAPDSHGLGTLFARLLEFVLKPFVFLGHEFARLAAAIWHWLIRSFLSSPVAPVAGTSGRSWERWELVLAALCLLLAGLVTVRWRQYRGSTSDAIAEPAEVDVATAAVTDQNEGEWFALSARLRENGQWRLALRAAFLGGLAGLGQRRLVTLRRDRTNREYLEEFSRWAVLHASGSTPDDLRQEFGNVVRDFNQVWYGGRDVNLQQLNDFVAAQRRLLSHV
ncbi:MAG: DUF4129 domain-containing protein, partial [Streptosporangiaceae bacterium]